VRLEAIESPRIPGRSNRRNRTLPGRRRRAHPRLRRLDHRLPPTRRRHGLTAAGRPVGSAQTILLHATPMPEQLVSVAGTRRVTFTTRHRDEKEIAGDERAERHQHQRRFVAITTQARVSTAVMTYGVPGHRLNSTAWEAPAHREARRHGRSRIRAFPGAVVLASGSGRVRFRRKGKRYRQLVRDRSGPVLDGSRCRSRLRVRAPRATRRAQPSLLRPAPRSGHKPPSTPPPAS
jgi:hypothetical protein